MMTPALSDNDVRQRRETLERLAAGVVMVGFPGQSVPPGTRELIARGVRGFILFARNVGERRQVRGLIDEIRALAGTDALVAIDHEGGSVNRLQKVATAWPSPMAWAATGDLDLVRRSSACMAEELAALGINLNFAPVADILNDHHNPVLGNRCFSDDPATTAAYTAAFVEGHRRTSVAATAKHFPGHGGTSVDSHIDLPRVDSTIDEMRQSDLIPFGAAIAAGVDCLMISHIWYSQFDERSTPAAISARIVDVARTDLGYKGVIVSDCLEMGAIQTRMTTSEAVVGAIRAGVDLALVSHTYDRQEQAIDALIAAVLNGTLPVERLVAANRKLDALRQRVRIEFTPQMANGNDLAHAIARQAVSVVRDRHATLPLRLSADESLGVVTFSAREATGVENPEGTASLLAGEVGRYHPQVVDAMLGEGSNSVPTSLHSVNTVLVGIYRATGRPEQSTVVDALLASGKRVVVVALNDPFDLLCFPDAPCCVVAYGDGPMEISAILAVLFGKVEARGRLPVALPGMFDRGHAPADGP